MKNTILAIGTAYVDIHYIGFEFDDGLLKHSETVGTEYKLRLGGSALNFARICDALEMRASFIGKKGNDLMGSVLETMLQKTHITPYFITTNDVSTNIGTHYIREDGVAIMTSCGSANQSLSAENIASEIEKCKSDIKYLYVGGFFKLKALIPYFVTLIEALKKEGVLIILDHGRINNSVTDEDILSLKKIMPLVDYYLPSMDECLAVWESSSLEQAFKKIGSVTQALTIVKDSENGAHTTINAENKTIPSYPVTIKSTVGAGDSFNAGFIKGIELSYPLVKCVQYANATAALKISEEQLPTHSSVEAMLRA